MLRAGRSIVYEPSAIVWHIHRAELAELRPHLYGYGEGLGAYIAKYVADPTTRSELLGRLPEAAFHMLGLWGRANDGAREPPVTDPLGGAGDGGRTVRLLEGEAVGMVDERLAPRYA